MKKKIIVLFTSLLLMFSVFAVPVHAEDTTLYWDGIYTNNDSSVVLEDGYDTSLWDTGRRLRFSVRPTHSICHFFTNDRYKYLTYYWYFGSSSSDNDTDLINQYNEFMNNISSSVDEIVSGSNNTTSSGSIRTASIGFNKTHQGDLYYYYAFYSLAFSNVIRAGHTSFAGNANISTGFLLALNILDRSNSTYQYVSSTNFYNENDRSAYSVSTLSNWDCSDSHSLDYFSTNVRRLMVGGVILPSGGTLTNPEYPEVEPTAEPTAEPTVEPTADSGSSSSQQQQQYQTISENAVNVTVTENDVISEETIQRLDQTLQNNNPYQTTFSTAIQTIDGFRQIGVKFAQTSEAFLAFLPSWVTDLLALMFVLLFFFIVLRLLKVFHG